MLKEAPESPTRKSRFVPVQAMKVQGCVELVLLSFIALALGGDNWSVLHSFFNTAQRVGQRDGPECSQKRKLSLRCGESKRDISVFQPVC
jgi:hypothetical protein